MGTSKSNDYRKISDLFCNNVIHQFKAIDTNNRNLTVTEIDLSKTENIKNNIINTINKCSQLNYHNITSILDNFIEDGKQYIIEESSGGSILPELLFQNYTPSDILFILRQIIETLNYSHSMGIYHNNLNVNNIFIDNFKNVKIGSFYLPHFGVFNEYSSILKNRGYTEYNIKYDINLAGLILMDMISGWQLKPQIKIYENVPLEKFSENLEIQSFDVKKILSRMVSKTPEYEFYNCAQLLEELKRVELLVNTPPANMFNNVNNSYSQVSAYNNLPQTNNMQPGYPPPIPTSKRQFKFDKKYAFIISGVLLLAVIAWYFFIFNTPTRNIYSYIKDRNYIKASEYYESHKSSLTPEEDSTINKLVSGMLLYDKQNYLRSSYFINNIDLSKISDKDIQSIIQNTQQLLNQKLERIKAELTSMLDSYSLALRTNSLEMYANLFYDNCKYFGNTPISKEELTKKMVKYFKDYNTPLHKFVLKSFGGTEDNLIQVWAEEYQSTIYKQNQNGKMLIVEKKLILKQEGNRFFIVELNNIDNILKTTKNSVAYKGYYFQVKPNKNGSDVILQNPDGSSRILDYISKDGNNSYSVLPDDYDNDGEPEILLYVFNKDEACCKSIKVYDLLSGSRSVLDLGSSLYYFKDLNGDGKREFLTYNNSFKYAFSSEESTVLPPVIYEYNGFGFNENTAIYVDYLRKSIAVAEKNIRDYANGNYFDCNSDLRYYQSLVAVVVVDKILSEGASAGVGSINSFLNCENVKGSFWRQVTNLVGSYNGIDKISLSNYQIY